MFLINIEPHKHISFIMYSVTVLRFSVGFPVATHSLSTRLAKVNDPEWAIFSGFLKDKSREQHSLDTEIHISIKYFLSVFKSILFSKWGGLFFNWQEIKPQEDKHSFLVSDLSDLSTHWVPSFQHFNDRKDVTMVIHYLRPNSFATVKSLPISFFI